MRETSLSGRPATSSSAYNIEVSLKLKNTNKTYECVFLLQKNTRALSCHERDLSCHPATSSSAYNIAVTCNILDETGSDRRNALRRRGYSWRGKPAISHKLLVRGEGISSIACISMKGVLECTMVTGSVDGDTFHAFVHSKLLPLLMLMPFNGKNPHSVVVMDNASIHHVDGIMDLITGVGALIFLPPYLPDYNPIEEAFSKVKTLKHIRKKWR